MNFLKENMFLVVTVAIVVAGVTVALLVGNLWGGQAETGGKTYASVSREINSLASGGINQAKVEVAKRRVGGMRNQAKEVTDKFLLRNHRGYEVMSFEISGRTVPAFPVNPEFRVHGTLKLLFPDEYRLRLKNLRETLKPTVPPTDEEIGIEAARIAASAMPAEKAENKEQPKPTAVPSRMDDRFGEGGMRERFRPADMERGRMGPMGRSPGTGVEQTGAEQKARINLVISKSEQGWIYADKERPQDRRGSFTGGTSDGGAMHVALPGSKTDYTDESLWLAQIGLWVQQDIVEAINLTNRQVRQTASGGQSGVAASAVKRLMSIDVRGYVLRGAGARGGDATTLRYLDLGERMGSSKPVPKLTGRVCNKFYDVVHYNFTVVLPMRHLLSLQKNLMAQNYHTILEISITRPEQSNMHYYGTDSVMKVTIVGEMLMLTNWTRGRWDKQTKGWDKNYQPLMPVKVLEQMREIDSDAVRDEDDTRLKPPDKAKTAKKTKRGGSRPM